MASMSYWQTECVVPAMPRGFHLITPLIIQTIAAMPVIQTGLVNLFLQHTSASLLLSENSCSAVRNDLETYFTQAIPDNEHLYTHTFEGADDMPAHLKNAILAVSLIIPLQKGQLSLGKWQGIFLGEHRNHASKRKILLTAHGTG